MDILEEAERMVEVLQAKVRADIEQAKREEEARKLPNIERLRALGMAN